MDVGTAAAPKRLLLQVRKPEPSPRELWLFLNPLYDEKRFAEQFQAQLARELGNDAFTARFDYYATGGSEGDGTEFSLADALEQTNRVIDYLSHHYAPDTIHLAGIRFGADMALHIAAHRPGISTLLLVEPLVKGSQYLRELQMRRKVLHSMLGMNVPVNVEENGKRFLDHFGYLISADDQALLTTWNSMELPLAGKDICLYTRSDSPSKPLTDKLLVHLQTGNTITEQLLGTVTDFWIYNPNGSTFNELTDHMINRIKRSAKKQMT